MLNWAQVLLVLCVDAALLLEKPVLTLPEPQNSRIVGEGSPGETCPDTRTTKSQNCWEGPLH